MRKLVLLDDETWGWTEIQRSMTVGAQLAGTVGSRITSAVTMTREGTRTDNERLANAQRLKA